MTRTTLAVAADYADALLVARRSKNVLFLILLLALLLQITVFFLYRYDALRVVTRAPADSTGTTAVVHRADGSTHSGIEVSQGLYKWVIDVTGFLGITLMVVLAVVLLLTSIIMLVGRLIGVSYVTSGFVWCVFLLAILFPWQCLWNSPPTPYSTSAYPLPVSVEQDQRLPGILMTWTEIEQGAHFDAKKVTPEVILHWARFAGWPVVAVLFLMIVQIKSSRGLRFALGESDIPVEVNTSRSAVDPGV